MIIGGVSGAGKTSSLRSGYSQRFLPCVATVSNSAIEAMINQTTRQPMTYTASIRIRNVADDAWIDLGTASYFQINKNSDGSIDSADVTIEQAEIWSAYITGGTYQSVLSPSGRACQIRAGLVINGTQYIHSLIYGRVASYSESQGGRSSSINIRLEDIRSQLLKITSVGTGYSQTAYRAMLREIKNFITAGGVISSGILKLLLFAPDSTLTTADTLPGSTLDAIESLIPSDQKTLFVGSGISLFGIQSSDTSNYSFIYDDDNVISLTRTASDGEQFNTVRIRYYSSGWQYAYIENEADVAIRGNVYSSQIIGGAALYTLAQVTQLANEAILVSLRGILRAEVVFNPYLEPGQVVKISSTKYSVPASYARIGSLTHQYSVGRASTYLNDLKLLAI